MRSQSFLSRALITHHWNKQFLRVRNDRGYWMNNAVIAEHVNRLMTGENTRWLPWLFSRYFAGREFRSALSLCCGEGSQELDMYNTDCVERIHGFDLSPGAIRTATERFRDARIPEDRYRFDVMDARRFSMPNQLYDCILSAGALHHLEELESMLTLVYSMLSHNGCFVLVEYIGPNYHQWTTTQLHVINAILGRIDPLFLRDRQRRFLKRPNRARLLFSDPSEAPHSRDVLPLVRQHFDVEYERSYNGTLIHPLHPLLNHDLVNVGNAEFDALVREILTLEADLIGHGILQSDFVFMVCRKSLHSGPGT